MHVFMYVFMYVRFKLPSVLFSYQCYFDFEFLLGEKATKSQEEMVSSLIFRGKRNNTYNHVQSKQ